MRELPIIDDKRLLGALDYIDERFIAEVTEEYEIFDPAPGAKLPPRARMYRFRQFAALAACLILLSFASLGVNYVANAVFSFVASAGGSNTETTEALNEPVNTEDLISDFNPNYELTEEDYANFEIAQKKKFNNNTVNYDIYHFYGKCSDSIVYWNDVVTCMVREIVIEDYLFTTNNGELIWVLNGQTIYTLEEAYEKGLITYADISEINKVHVKVKGFGGGKIDE